MYPCVIKPLSQGRSGGICRTCQTCHWFSQTL